MALSVLALGCTPDLAYPPLEEEAWPFRFYSDDPLPQCTVAVATEHYDRWSEKLGIELQDDEFIDVLVHEHEYVHDFCDGSACAWGRRAIVPYPYYPHELIHAYASERGRSIRLLEEGLATYSAGCQGIGHAGSIETSIDIRSIARSSDHASFSDASQEEVYVASASFVAYLVERFGWSAFMELYEALGHGDGLGAIDERFQGVLGESLDALVSAWELWPKPTGLELCAREAAPILPLSLGVEMETYCVEPSIGGTDGNAAEPGLVAALSVNARSRLELRLEEEVGATSEVRTLDLPANRVLRTQPNTGATLHTYDLPIGDHEIRTWTGPYVSEAGETFPTYLASLEPRDPDPCLESAIDVTDITTIAYGEMLGRTTPDGVHAVLTVEVTEPRWIVGWEIQRAAVTHFCVDACAAGTPCVHVSEVLPSITGSPIVLDPGQTYRIVLTRLDADALLWTALYLVDPV